MRIVGLDRHLRPGCLPSRYHRAVYVADPHMRMQRRKRRIVTQILKALAVGMASMFHNACVTRTIVLRLQNYRDMTLETIPMIKNSTVASVAEYLDLPTPRFVVPPPAPRALAKDDRQDVPRS